jgi:tripartite-type tricarboxylate transporter receptor subunit TctC
VTTAKRLPGLDQVPTVAETYPGFEYSGWQAVVAPKGTPADVIRRFSADLAGVLTDPDMVKRLFDLGVIAEASTAEQLAQYLDAEHARWAKLAKDIGVVPE